jgi:hypothetical protein
MLIRAIGLTLALLIGLGTIVPLATEYAEAGPRHKKYKKKKKRERNWRGVKKYSKRWWQLYRAQERRKKALAKRRRALRLRQMRFAAARKAAETPAKTAATEKPAKAAAPPAAAMLPSGSPAPAGWQKAEATPGEVSFKVDNGNGLAAISVVGPAIGETAERGRRGMVGGVPTTSLRREVINRMIRENGWVVNDYQKEIGGKAVYVVVAQSQAAGGRVNARMFYFTEVDGRIYSVATNSPANSAEQLAEESEKVIYSLQATARPVQQATK